MGVGVAVGAQTGVYVYAEASVGSSKSNANSTTWQKTTLTGQNISLKAEGDTTLRGATATGDRIDVKTGGTLTISALSQAVGALAAGVAGGAISHAALGAGTAKNSVENNRLLNDMELARIKELSNGDVLREAELTAAACALVKCSSGFAEGSEEWARWAAVEALGSTPEAQDDRDWMKAQVQPGYLYTAGNSLATENKLFS